MIHAALKNFQAASQAIYKSWHSQTCDSRLSARFQTEYLPEPYLDFAAPDGEEFCLFLTTNPGRGREEQSRPGVARLAGGSLPDEYLPLSRVMARFYEAHLDGAAGANIKRMKRIAHEFGRPRVLQVEMIPWHSVDLPNKNRVYDELVQMELFHTYSKALKELLILCPVVFSWSAGTPSKRDGVGMKFKADAMRLNLASANLYPIIRRPGGTSQGLFWKQDPNRIAGLFVTQGSANLPADRGDTYKDIASALRA